MYNCIFCFSFQQSWRIQSRLWLDKGRIQFGVRSRGGRIIGRIGVYMENLDPRKTTCSAKRPTHVSISIQNIFLLMSMSLCIRVNQLTEFTEVSIVYEFSFAQKTECYIVFLKCTCFWLLISTGHKLQVFCKFIVRYFLLRKIFSKLFDSMTEAIEQ